MVCMDMRGGVASLVCTYSLYTYVYDEDTQLVTRAIGVSHTAWKYKVWQNL